MAEKKDAILNTILVLILVLKVMWLLSLVNHFILKSYYVQYHEYIEINNNIEYFLHDIFTLSIGILLIYLYNHLTPKQVCVEGHTKFYLYSFGILSLIGTLQKWFHRYYFREYRELEHGLEHGLDSEL
jgi:hypothetical protein